MVILKEELEEVGESCFSFFFFFPWSSHLDVLVHDWGSSFVNFWAYKDKCASVIALPPWKGYDSDKMDLWEKSLVRERMNNLWQALGHRGRGQQGTYRCPSDGGPQ